MTCFAVSGLTPGGKATGTCEAKGELGSACSQYRLSSMLHTHNRSSHRVNGRRTLVPFGSKTWEVSLLPLTVVLSAGADFLPIIL